MAVRAKALQIVKHCYVTIFHVFNVILGMMNLNTCLCHLNLIVLGWIHFAPFTIEKAVFRSEVGFLPIG